MLKIKNVILTNDSNICILEFENSKKTVKRVIKKSVNNDNKYFIYNKQEYFLNNLYQKNIYLIK